VAEQQYNPPKYNRTLHWPWSQTVHKDDKYHQNPEFFVGKEVVLTEKLDGGNTCLWNGEVYARSTGEPSHHGWMAMVRKHHGWKTLQDGVRKNAVFYGEDMFGIHSIEYDALDESETFRLFAVRFVNEFMDADQGFYASYDMMVTYAEELGVIPVPLVYRGTFDSVDEITSFFETEIKKPSSLGGECEGFVMRLADSFDVRDFGNSVAKYVRANHVQTDEHWTRTWKTCKLK